MKSGKFELNIISLYIGITNGIYRCQMMIEIKKTTKDTGGCLLDNRQDTLYSIMAKLFARDHS